MGLAENVWWSRDTQCLRPKTIIQRLTVMQLKCMKKRKSFATSLDTATNNTSNASHLLGWHAERRALSDDSRLDDDAGHDGVPRVEDEVGHDPDLAGEHGLVLELLPLLALQLVLVGDEPVEQVVDDVGLKASQV